MNNIYINVEFKAFNLLRMEVHQTFLPVILEFCDLKKYYIIDQQWFIDKIYLYLYTI